MYSDTGTIDSLVASYSASKAKGTVPMLAFRLRWKGCYYAIKTIRVMMTMTTNTCAAKEIVMRTTLLASSIKRTVIKLQDRTGTCYSTTT